MSFGPDPWLQENWDWRAAMNFVCGGAGGGFIVAAVVAGSPPAWLLAGAALVGAGLVCVALEIGRPLRALNVFVNPRSSWMSRESIAAGALMLAVALALVGATPAAGAAAVIALVFVYCQGNILRAARGIPAWREPMVVPLFIATGLTEGTGLWLAAGAALGAPASRPACVALVLLLVARLGLWVAWRRRLRTAPGALAAVDRAGRVLRACSGLAAVFALVALAPLPPALVPVLEFAAGVLAAAAGAWFKFTLVTRTAFNQGFALVHLPVRGTRRAKEDRWA
jgi:phenylacetyl-CoA:acceptor oxidoreductase 26-kDa subunit